MLRSGFNEFCRTTGIRNFSFLLKSRYTLEWAMWAVLIIVTSAWAARDCVRSIAEYLNDPMYTKLSYSKNLSITLLNDPIVCIEIDSLHYNTLANVSDPNLLSTALEHLASIGDKNDTQLTLMAAQFVGLVSILETPLVSNNFREKLPWMRYLYNGQSNKTNLIKSMQVLKNNFKDNFRSLRNRIGTFLCNLMEVRLLAGTAINYIQPAVEIDICNDDNIVWLGSCPYDSGPEELCFQLPKEQLMFDKLLDYILISLKPENLYKENAKIFAEYLIFDFDGNRVISGVREQIQTFLMEKTFVGVTTVGHYLTRPTRVRPCLKNQSDVDCMGLCTAAIVEQNCGCWPANWVDLKNYQHTSPICIDRWTNMTVYINHMENCLSKMTYSIELTKCQKSCRSRCESQFYKFAKEKVVDGAYEYDLAGSANKTVMILELGQMDLVEFQEVPMIEFNTLLSRIGGTLALWMGANFLAFYHAGFFIFRSLVEFVVDLHHKK